MKIKISIFFIISISLNIHAWGQDRIPFLDFDNYPPIRKLRCGLWTNGVGDIAIKEKGPAYPNSFQPPVVVDSLGYITELPEPIEFKVRNNYITHTYNLQDSLNNMDNDYRSELKDVVDTTTFEILGAQYCKDKNNIYIIQSWAYGSVMFAQPYDKKFKVLKTNPEYAFSSKTCFYQGWYLEDSDPKTFQIIDTDDYALSRDKNNFYWGWSKMKDDEICEMERKLAIEIFTQKELKIYADSLFYVKEVPYIENCKDPIFWRIVNKGKSIIPLLIDKLTDTRVLKDVYVHGFGGEYTVADVAYIALCEIISDIPTFELLGVDFDEKGCEYCSYWNHLREKGGNRKRFRKAMSKWYNSHKDYLEWDENKTHSNTGDCSNSVKSGHYKVREVEENILVELFLSNIDSKQCYIYKPISTTYSNSFCLEDSIIFEQLGLDAYLNYNNWYVYEKEKFDLKILKEFEEYARRSALAEKQMWDTKAPIFNSRKFKNLKFISDDEITDDVRRKGYRCFSLPLFSKNREYLIITQSSFTPYIYNSLQQFSSDCVYKREGNTWIKIAERLRVIS